MQEQQHHNNKRKKKHISNPQYINLNPFKQMEKHFKHYQHKETDYSILYEPQEYQIVNQYQIARLPFPKGAILVRNFNSEAVVLNIAAQALNQYCVKPYRTNLDSRTELYQQQKQEGQEKDQKEYNKEQNKEVPVNKGYTFNDKIRWANVGYQYDWTQRKYPNVKTKIPEAIDELCFRANKLFNAINQTQKNYHPESAIINYYSEKDYMTGHLDDAQIDQISPIYSFSIGLSCIFLIGGKSKEEKPISIRLNSGDLLIMSEEARLAYHGVPRILSNTFHFKQKLQMQQQATKLNKYQHIESYLKGHRININVRQVFPIEQQ